MTEPTEATTLLVIGGTSGIGREIAERAAGRGETVIISGRQAEHAEQVAAEIGGDTRGIAVDLAQPGGLAEQLASVDRVDHLVLAAIARDQNTLDSYDYSSAVDLVLMKLVGNTQAIHVLQPVMTADAAIVVFGGQAFRIPYPGSTTVSTVNGGVEGLVHSIATQIAPVRINGIHPGIVGDSPAWEGKSLDPLIAQTPLGRLATMEDIADAVEFLLRNRSVNGECLTINGGRYLR